MVNAVCNWVGSLSDFPFFFELSAKSGTTILPYVPIADNNTVLLMRDLEISESVENQECSCDFKDIIVTLYEQYKSNLCKKKSMLCHRNTGKFWELIFRQKIDFSICDVSVIWAG